LGRALQGARPAHGNPTDLRQHKKAIDESSATMLSDLGIGKTIIAVTPMKTGIARCLPFAETAEERLKCSFYPEHNILQDLAVDLSVFGHRFFDVWYFCPLLVVGDGHAALVPGFAT